MSATSHFNQLTEAEAERLAFLLEEMGEAQQAIGKILRHGYESRHPDGGPTNRMALGNELGDVYHAMARVFEAGDLDEDAVIQHAVGKVRSAGKYMHHQ